MSQEDRVLNCVTDNIDSSDVVTIASGLSAESTRTLTTIIDTHKLPENTNLSFLQELDSVQHCLNTPSQQQPPASPRPARGRSTTYPRSHPVARIGVVGGDHTGGASRLRPCIHQVAVGMSSRRNGTTSRVASTTPLVRALGPRSTS